MRCLLYIFVAMLWAVPAHGQYFPSMRGEQPREEGRGDGGVRVAIDDVSRVAAGDVLRVALMLPLEGTQPQGNDFTELYRGVLLGLEDLKARGDVRLDVVVYDTAGSADNVFNTVIAPDFATTDLIIGPVYEREMGPAVQFAELMSIPIVSPLATVRKLDSEVMYQMAPDPAAKYDKLRELFGGGGERMTFGDHGWENEVVARKNIIVVSSATGNDAEFEREIVGELVGVKYKSFTITDEVGVRRGVTGEDLLGAAGDIATLMDWDAENVFIVLGEGELAVQRALATISSSYANASARLSRQAQIKVVGSSRWAQLAGVDRNLFFRLGVRFVTSYYIDRSDARVRRFEERFMAAYGDLPTRAAFRGYDAAVMFVGAVTDGMAVVEAQPLRVPYHFVRQEDFRRRVNSEWTLVEFTPDFNVVVK